MSTEKMREDFNHWYDNERKKAAPFSTVNIRDKCFEAWQASRAAIEVVLPKGGNMWGDEPVDISRSDAVTAIESLGLKVKP